MRRTLPILLLLSCLAQPAQALIVPMTGWVPVNGDANYWADASGTCLMREERHDQPFPVFHTPQDAQIFAVKLQETLDKQVDGVVTQPVDRAGEWGVLAAFDYFSDGVIYRITQLYLSDNGKLRTITGSSATDEANSCVHAMREFIRYLAN